MRPDRLGAIEGAGEVHAEVALPEIEPLVGELADVVERARVVDEDVHRAEVVDDPRDRRVDVGAIGDVAAHGERAPAEATDLLDRPLGVHHPLRDRGLREHPVVLRRARVRLDEDVGDRHVGPGPGERQRIGPAEAARAAGDECDAARKVDVDGHRRDPTSSSGSGGC